METEEETGDGGHRESCSDKYDDPHRCERSS